ncbi:MAG: transcriptional regulator, partial [Tolypothrix sp. Co-bin9]|nr:transcriptional regulator [Tolypothrix sp. Co-bin9]
IEDDMINDVRQVVRRVANPFWLIREVSRYWEDCVIVSPESLRDRLKQKLCTLCELYDIETKS